MKSLDESLDVYSEVARRTGFSRNLVKLTCFPAFYTSMEVFEGGTSQEELVEALVKYINNRKASNDIEEE